MENNSQPRRRHRLKYPELDAETLATLEDNNQPRRRNGPLKYPETDAEPLATLEDNSQPRPRGRPLKYPELDAETLATLERQRRPPGRPREEDSVHQSRRTRVRLAAPSPETLATLEDNSQPRRQCPPLKYPELDAETLATLERQRRPPGRPREEDSVHQSRRTRLRLAAPSQVLVDAYNERQVASTLFPSKITSSHVRAAMKRYENVIEQACTEVEASCASCGDFKAEDDLSLIPRDDQRLHIMENEETLQLDNCSQPDESYRFCKSCFQALNIRMIPKFSALNAVNVTMCQYYPPELEDLTLMEQYTIARSHPIGAILKLRPNGLQNATAYNAIRGHIITIPQNPGPLLDILPSPDLQFHDYLRIVWLGKSDPTTNDLKPFVQVRKDKILRALLWLCENNPLYESVTINRDLIDRWEASFIPPVLQDSIVNISPEEDSEERGTYAGDMDGFAENDLHHAMDDMADGTIASGAVHTDVEGLRLNPELKMVLALIDLTNKADGSSANTGMVDGQNPIETPVITWRSDNTVALMNDYEDPTYFTSAFPTLFPYGKGGHMPSSDQRTIPVSLEAWAKWCLNHHSRRFARHPTFIYLIYDVIQRRKAALGNSLLVKRKNYEAVREVISSLTYDRLIAAAQSLRTSQKISDPAIAILRHAVQAVASRVPNSFAQKAEMRLFIQALIIEFGLPAFWLTINPSDLRDLLVLKLAGISISSEMLESVNAQLQRKMANMNPAAVAVFFHKICTAVLEGLICPQQEDIGILGDVSTYFGVVESNGRGMLHLHGFVWLKGNVDFLRLREKILNDPIFAQRMIEYLNSIVSECINSYETEDTPDDSSYPKTQDFNTDESYMKALRSYGEAVAGKRQMHSKTHNSTCFKYCKKGTRECRFNFPRPICEESHSDSLGVIHLLRNNEWINPYNICLAAAIGSNHDLSFINTKAKSLALTYYMTNYSTKDEASTYQMLMTGAALKKALEQAQQATDPTDEEKRTLEKGISKFSLRLFNRMSLDREVSGVQVASSLLQLPAYYTPRRDLYRLNLYYLRRRFQSIIRPSEDNEDDEAINTEQVTLRLADKRPVTCFEDYRWRGSDLKNLSLYEYLRLVRKRPIQNRVSSDIDFATDHPEHGEKTQIICDPSSIPRAVALVGPLSRYQDIEDRVKGGQPNTQAIQNDVAAILLALFIPWEELPTLFADAPNTCDDEYESIYVHCASIWAQVEPSLPMYIRDFARNIQLLRKSKNDGQIDIAQRRAAAAAAMEGNQSPHDLDDEILEAVDLDMFEDVDTNGVDDNTSVDDTSLFIACHLLRSRWREQDAFTTANIPALYQRRTDIPDLCIDNFAPIVTDSTSGIRQDISDGILKQWADLIKGTKVSASTGVDTNINIQVDNDDDSDLDNEYGLLEPVLSFTQSDVTIGLNMDDLISQVGQYASASKITDVITKAIPLNAKQKRIVSMVFYHMLRLRNKSSITLEDQFLLFVTGEGGTGKSRVINAIRLGMTLLHREQELLVLAPTGNAASHVGGSTIHTGLNVNIGNRRKKGPSSRVRALWSTKTILIIDEISMVGSKLMDSIDNQCKVLKNLDSNSTAVFGGLHVVLVLGDFHQFPPVQAKALWQKQESQEEKRGQLLWHLFKDTIVLTEQMRQQDDTEYYNLLTRARNATLTEADVDTLNSRVISRFESLPDRPNTCIVRSNKLRFIINRQQYEPLAQYQQQQIFLFPARHSRHKMVNRMKNIDIDKLLELQDSSTVKSPGLFTYVKNMPAAILSNISTPLGIVNGAQGKIVGIIPDSNAKFYRMDSSHILCTLPPKCILFDPLSSKNAIFPEIGSTAVPVFSSSTSVKVDNISVVRHQVPVTPAWAMTDYKVQGATYDNITVDLHRSDNNKNKETRHKRYCSNYVQLTRTKSLQGLNLLQPVTLADVNVKPSPLLVQEDERLAKLATLTDVAWKAVEASDDYKLERRV